MAKFKDYYKLLELEPYEDIEAVKASFRKLARKYHPDINPGNPAFEEKFKEINEAYDILSDAEKKARYDQSLRVMNRTAAPSSKAQKSTGAQQKAEKPK